MRPEIVTSPGSGGVAKASGSRKSGVQGCCRGVELQEIGFGGAFGHGDIDQQARLCRAHGGRVGIAQHRPRFRGPAAAQQGTTEREPALIGVSSHFLVAGRRQG